MCGLSGQVLRFPNPTIKTSNFREGMPPIEDLNEWFWDRKETWERKRKRKKGLEKKSPHEGEYDFEGDRVLMVSVFFFSIIALTQNYVVRRPSPRHKSNPMAHSPQIDLESV